LRVAERWLQYYAAGFDGNGGLAAGIRLSRIERLWRRRLSGRRVETAYEVAADIESYPEFLPGVIDARIVARRNGRWTVDNVFGLWPVRTHFRSFATPEPPAALTIVSRDGPWREFRLRWRFRAEGADVWAECDFAAVFRSPVLGLVAATAIDAAEGMVMDAFERRTRERR